MLPKFNPFDRRTAALPPAIEVVGLDVEGWSGREYLSLRVLNTAAAHALLEKNWADGAIVQHGGKFFVVQSKEIEAPDAGLFLVRIEVLPLTISASKSSTGEAVPRQVAKVTAPKQIRRLIQ